MLFIEGGKIRMAYQGNLLSKTLVKGIIFLFICTGITLSIAVDNVKKSVWSVSNGNTLYVGGIGVGNYTTIQSAVDNASDGDTVFVYNGTYHEDNVHIRYKSINLVGEDKNTTIIANTFILIYSSRNVIIHGFTIIKEVTHTEDINIEFLNCSNCTFYDNIVQSNLSLLRGIYIVESSEIKIFKNTIKGARNSIGIDDSQNCVIQDNYITSGNCGIQIYHSTNVTVFRNHISKYQTGISIDFPKNVDVIQNNLVGNFFNVGFLVLESENLFEFFFDGNYWSRPRLLPHLIIGFPMIGHRLRIIPIIKFDWHPAKEPYKIEGVI